MKRAAKGEKEGVKKDFRQSYWVIVCMISAKTWVTHVACAREPPLGWQKSARARRGARARGRREKGRGARVRAHVRTLSDGES